MGRKTSNLQEYRAKRNFKVTPEPPPRQVEPTSGAPTFMVHKHDASRLHYDLRLEMDGALASWSVPRGPSYDPSTKRLAVQTEDHPLEYGNFEGRIPDFEYGAGDSLIWDAGTYDTVPPGEASAQRKKGHLNLELRGQKLQGRWHLVRTTGGWLLFKAKDGKEDPGYDVVAQRPESVRSGRVVTRGPVRKKDLRAPHPEPRDLMRRVWPPMLATLSDRSRAGPLEDFVFEVKYDGYRGLAAVSSGRVCFHTRNGLDLQERFPDLGRALSRLVVPEVVLDGEVVAYDARGVSHFESLMTPGADHRFVVFDLLWLDGEDLRPRPLEERRDLLQSVLANVPPPLESSERLPGSLAQALASAERRGLEGIIAKQRGSRYDGRRSRAWLKLKLSLSQEVVIVGFTPITNGKAEIGALLVAVREAEGYRYAGKVGTGYSARLRKELWQTLQEERVEAPSAVDAPRIKVATWVRPTRVAQVRFTEWTRDGRLRHPSFVALRLDKRPEEARRELPARPRAKEAEVASKPAQKSARGPGSLRSGERRARPEVAARHARAEEEVALTSADRVVYPAAGITKAEVFRYYRDVAEVMVPALSGRPLALKQWPRGLSGEGFFRQDVQDLPSWATFAEVDSARRKRRHPVVDRPSTLLWLANRSALELHMWHSRLPHLTEPDWVVFDLDPAEGRFDDLISVTLALRGLLEKLGLFSVPKTTGQRGLHVLVPVSRGHTYADTLNFAVAVSGALARALPDLATTERSRSKRKGRLYLDALQNAEGKTIIAPYSLRGQEGAPISAPLKWTEITRRLDPTRYTLKTMRRRLGKVGDLFAPALQGGQRLPRFGGGGK